MSRKIFLAVCLFVMASLLFNIHTVSAHTTIQVGKYQVEIGWVSEPPIVGQQNAIVVNVSSGDSNSTPPDKIDVSGLKVDVVYGGETKSLNLQPLGEDTPGQYVAPILPTRPGKYTIRLSGNLGDSTNISGEVQPEEVETADVLQFPKAPNSQSSSADFGLTGWLAVIGMVCGLAGLVLAVVALRKNR
jgi:hypothetical protein